MKVSTQKENLVQLETLDSGTVFLDPEYLELPYILTEVNKSIVDANGDVNDRAMAIQLEYGVVEYLDLDKMVIPLPNAELIY
jgi:hypothetical protein